MKSHLKSTTEKTYLALAVFITIFIFFPIGVFAIKYSLEAKRLYESNSFAEARSAANTSKRLIILSLAIAGSIYGAGLLGWLYLILRK